MNSGLFDLNRRHKKLVIQGIDVAAVLISSVTGLVFFGGLEASSTATWQYLLLALVANYGALRLSRVYSRVLRYGLIETLRLLAVSITAATLFIVVTGPAFLSVLALRKL